MSTAAIPALIYFVDDDPKAGELWLRYFRDTPYDCEVFGNPVAALDRYRSRPADLVITDLRMPDMTGIQLLEAIRGVDSRVPVIVITAYASIDSAVEALRLGATDFIKKPYDMDELGKLVARVLDQRQGISETIESPQRSFAAGLHHGMVGDSSAMHKIYRVIDKLARVQCSVVIEGESGTGKELAARAIHDAGPRAEEPFVVVDCGSIADSLLQSELFGHRRGAFTGADSEREGLLQAAGQGTVFLDEIGNISDAMQTKLLRVLQEGTFTPVGGNRVVATGARFIAATNRNLRELVDDGGFRLDLYHRLNVVTLHMPSLSHRPEDIPALVRLFSAQLAAQYQRPIRCFSRDGMRRLCERRWEGNVRELRNYVERCFIMSDGKWLDTENGLLEAPRATNGVQKRSPPTVGPAKEVQHTELEHMEERHIREVLDSTGGNQSRAAELLGIHRTTLWRKLRHMHKGDE